MPARRRTRRTKCVACGELAETTVLGRCPKCVGIETGASKDWRLDACLTRAFVRHDGAQLSCVVMKSAETWLVIAVATARSGSNNEARDGTRYVLGRPVSMIAALEIADVFGRAWLEKSDTPKRAGEEPS